MFGQLKDALMRQQMPLAQYQSGEHQEQQNNNIEDECDIASEHCDEIVEQREEDQDQIVQQNSNPVMNAVKNSNDIANKNYLKLKDGESSEQQVVIVDRCLPRQKEEKLTIEREVQCGEAFAMEESEEYKLIKAIIDSNFIGQLENLLQNVDVSSVMQLNLINDLMDLAKMNEGKFQFDNDFFDLNELVGNALNQVRFSARQNKVNLKKEVLSELPSDQEVDPLKLIQCIYGDKRRYLQCMLNFLSNALKFTLQDGTVTVRVILLEVQNIFDFSIQK